MRSFLSILFVLALASVARAELSVEWIDGNTIRVSGDGYTVVTNNVYTNCLGTCTNCLAISPDEMRFIKSEVLHAVDDAIIYNNNIAFYASSISNSCLQILSDISTFRRFGFQTSTSINAMFPTFTNYIHGVENEQTQLDRNYSSNNSSNGKLQRVAYNDGIYDYANTIIKPNIEAQLYYCGDILSNSDDVGSRLSVIRSIVDSITVESCQGCGGGGGGDGGGSGGDSCGDCPCAEQLDAIKDYVEHIDDDFHVQLQNMSDVTNFIPRMDSYARLVSGILYNDATIVVDDGENSWSNVYLRGESDLYDYDKSNILQRIELLLYGLVSNTSTNWGSATSDVSSDVSAMQDTIDDVKASVSDANAEYTSEISTISQKVTGLFDSLNFFGAGSLGNFAYGEPMQFDVYDFQFDFTNAADFRPLQQVCRTAMQIFYWTAGVVFMLVFWYRVVKFTTDFALRVIHFFNNLLT